MDRVALALLCVLPLFIPLLSTPLGARLLGSIYTVALACAWIGWLPERTITGGVENPSRLPSRAT